MKLLRTGVSPAVKALPSASNYDVELHLGSLRFEMSAAEAHELADRLVDAAEKGGRDAKR